MFSSTQVLSSKHYLINIGTWVGVQRPVIFANIYGPQPVTEKANMWNELKGIIQTYDGVWILLGDFNVVRRPYERFNSIFYNRTARDFNNFINEVGLRDQKMGGFRFTCFRNEDLKLSKLDHFLLSPRFLDIAPTSMLTRANIERGKLIMDIIEKIR